MTVTKSHKVTHSTCEKWAWKMICVKLDYFNVILYFYKRLKWLKYSVWSCRRGGQWITCHSHASTQGTGEVTVSVYVDKAHIQKDLLFEYVEDPTITKLEPEWSIFRWKHIQSWWICSAFWSKNLKLIEINAKNTLSSTKCVTVLLCIKVETHQWQWPEPTWTSSRAHKSEPSTTTRRRPT